MFCYPRNKVVDTLDQMMKNPIICFDLDGTLLDEDERIHPNDFNLLKKGVTGYVIATGRSLQSVKITLARNGLFANQPIPFPLILQNGAMLCMANEVNHSYSSINTDLRDEIVRISLMFPEVTFLFHASDRIFMVNPGPFGIAAAQRYEFETNFLDENSKEIPFGKVMCICDDTSRLKAVAKAMAHLPAEFALSMPTIFEITAPGVNKGSGLKTLLNVINPQKEPVIVAGDGENDISMFPLADISFAPDTAPVWIQEKAGRILSINGTGLFQAIFNAIGYCMDE
jgi:Cof subfamily protein (haloacid dehalogenase superfamily)